MKKLTFAILCNTMPAGLNILNKMLNYRRETALQGALQFSPK